MQVKVIIARANNSEKLTAVLHVISNLPQVLRLTLHGIKITMLYKRERHSTMLS